MKRFLIFTNKQKDEGLEVTKRIEAYLADAGCDVSVITQGFDWRLELPGQTDEGKLWDVDCMLVLGGDGTVLQAVRQSQGSIPLIGVNLGTLGYMTEIETAGLTEALRRLVSDDYIKESRMMLSGKVLHNTDESCETEKEEWALNDIVIARNGPLQIINYRIYVNGLFLHEYNADGVIVTTPTGSTGYNLSAGGPLVEPGAELIMLTPICPHTLNQRSIILSSADVIEIEITESRAARSQMVEVNFDGNLRVPIGPGERIRITKWPRNMEFIRLNQVSFLETLHKKMNE